MFLALLWMERWLKFLSDASAQYAPPQLTHATADQSETKAVEGPAANPDDTAAVPEEADLLQDALDERDQALAGLLLARSELLSQLARVSGEAEQHRTTAAAQLNEAGERAEQAEQELATTQRALAEAQAVLEEAKHATDLLQAAREEAAAAGSAVAQAQDAADQAIAERNAALAVQHAWAGENERLKEAQRAARVQFAIERATLLAERDAALLAERSAWGGENDRLKEAQRRARVRSAIEQSATLTERQAWIDENERLKSAQRLGKVRSAADQMAQLAARSESVAKEAPAKQASGANQPETPAKANVPARSTRTRVRKTKAASESSDSADDSSQAPTSKSASPAPAAPRARPAQKPARAAPQDPAQKSATGTLMVGFQKPSDWAENTFVYFWDTDPLTKAPEWPGVPMQPGPSGWFVHHFQGVHAAHLIFTDDAGHQTPNLHRTASGWLDENGEWQAEPPSERT